MNRHDAAFAVAGIIGGAGAVVHGVLTQRYLVDPLQELVAPRVSRVVQKLVVVLLQFSTFNWMVGAVALFVAASTLGKEGRFATGLLVGSSYLFGTVGNFWATRGRHPGWVVFAVSFALIIYGLLKPSDA